MDHIAAVFVFRLLVMNHLLDSPFDEISRYSSLPAHKNVTAEAALEGMSMEFDVIVLGAGISGLVSAAILLQQGNERVLVVDDYTRVGGNHIDRTEGGYTFDVGSLIFQDDSPLLQHFPELLPLYVPIDPSWGKLNPQGVITTYPFSVRDDFIAAGPVECIRMLLSAARSRLRRKPMASARDFAEYWIGERLLHRSGLENYMERFCGLPAQRIDLKFAEKRMLWISEQATVVKQIRGVWGRLRRRATRHRRSNQDSANQHRTNQQLARPREGFTHLYQPAVEGLEQRGATFLLGAGIQRLDKVPDGFELRSAAGSFGAPRVVSTIPIDRLRDFCGTPAETPLPTVTLISLFFSFSGERGFEQPILYNFSHDGAWKRLTVYSDFYGEVHGREYFGVEVIADALRSSAQEAMKDFRQHTAANGLFVGDLQLEGSHTLDNAYPIYTEGAGDRAQQAIAELRAFGIESFGRQGAFQYQPTARVSTLEAEAALSTG